MDVGLDQPGADQPAAGIVSGALGGEARRDGGDAALLDADIDTRGFAAAGQAGVAYNQVHDAVSAAFVPALISPRDRAMIGIARRRGISR